MQSSYVWMVIFPQRFEALLYNFLKSQTSNVQCFFLFLQIVWPSAVYCQRRRIGQQFLMALSWTVSTKVYILSNVVDVVMRQYIKVSEKKFCKNKKMVLQLFMATAALTVPWPGLFVTTCIAIYFVIVKKFQSEIILFEAKQEDQARAAVCMGNVSY